MMTSTKTGIGSAIVWLVSSLVVQWLAPDTRGATEGEVLAIGGPLYIFLSVAQMLANLSIVIAVIALAITGLSKIGAVSKG